MGALCRVAPNAGALIEGLGGLAAKLDAKLAALKADVKVAVDAWAGLGRCSARRDDHAADLLLAVSVAVHSLASFATAVHAQIEAVRADPFGE